MAKNKLAPFFPTQCTVDNSTYHTTDTCQYTAGYLLQIDTDQLLICVCVRANSISVWIALAVLN